MRTHTDLGARRTDSLVVRSVTAGKLWWDRHDPDLLGVSWQTLAAGLRRELCRPVPVPALTVLESPVHEFSWEIPRYALVLRVYPCAEEWQWRWWRRGNKVGAGGVEMHDPGSAPALVCRLLNSQPCRTDPENYFWELPYDRSGRLYHERGAWRLNWDADS